MNSILTAKQHDKLTGAALQVILGVQYGLSPSQRQKQMAAAYCPWAGLVEAHAWTEADVVGILREIQKQCACSEKTTKAVLDIYEDAELPSDHPYGVLLQHKTLVPYFKALRSRYPKANQNLKPAISGEIPRPELPMVVPKSPLNEQDAKKPSQPAARIDRAIEVWLGDILNNRRNVSAMRLYLSIVGACILAGHSKERRDTIFFDPEVVHSLAAKTAAEQEMERKRIETEKEVKKAEREKKKAEKKAEKEEKKRAKNSNNTGTGNAPSASPVGSRQ